MLNWHLRELTGFFLHVGSFILTTMFSFTSGGNAFLCECFRSGGKLILLPLGMPGMDDFSCSVFGFSSLNFLFKLFLNAWSNLLIFCQTPLASFPQRETKEKRKIQEKINGAQLGPPKQWNSVKSMLYLINASRAYTWSHHTDLVINVPCGVFL